MEYPKTLRFTSQYRNYKIFLVPPTNILMEGQLVRREGKMLEFSNWECTTSDPETIKLALESGYYGKDYIAPEWEKMKMQEKEKEEKKSEVPVSTAKTKGKPAKGI